MLPFTREEFISVFVGYNTAIWPAQIVAYALGVIAVACLFRPSRASDRLIAGALAAMWVWTGIAYHGLFFSEINNAAFLFGLMFVAESALIAHCGLVHDRLQFAFSNSIAGWAGLAFLAYAGILYPLIGVLAGHAYPEMPMFGVTPCPVTIFTFGFFLLFARTLLWRLLIVPFLWSLIGGSAAILLNVPQDWALLAGGVVSLLLLWFAKRPAAAV
jgi:hypothetical protein